MILGLSAVNAVATGAGPREPADRDGLGCLENVYHSERPSIEDGTDLATGLREFAEGKRVSVDWVIQDDEWPEHD